VDPDAVGVTDLPGRLESLVRSTPWLLEALRAARDVDPPDWLVGGGVLRDLVWDRLHGRSRSSPPRDLDLAFFDPARLDPARDAEVEQALASASPSAGPGSGSSCRAPVVVHSPSRGSRVQGEGGGR
jgi:hypothetical protein